MGILREQPSAKTVAQAATQQVPLADIAALPMEGKKDVTVTGCVPGFYYTLYGAATLPIRGGLIETALPEAAYGPELSGVSGEVTFPEVVKPSDSAGFFSIGVKEAPGVTPSDSIIVKQPKIPVIE